MIITCKCMLRQYHGMNVYVYQLDNTFPQKSDWKSTPPHPRQKCRSVFCENQLGLGNENHMFVFNKPPPPPVYSFL